MVPTIYLDAFWEAYEEGMPFAAGGGYFRLIARKKGNAAPLGYHCLTSLDWLQSIGKACRMKMSIWNILSFLKK